MYEFSGKIRSLRLLSMRRIQIFTPPTNIKTVVLISANELFVHPLATPCFMTHESFVVRTIINNLRYCYKKNNDDNNNIDNQQVVPV